MIWIHNVFTWPRRNSWWKAVTLWRFQAAGKCLRCLISGQVGKMDSGMDTKSLQLSKHDEKKWDYPCKWKHRWGNMTSEFIKVWLRGCRLKAWVTAHLCFFSWILPGMERGNKTADVAGSICFLLIQTASALHLVCQGVDTLYCTCAVSEMFTITAEVRKTKNRFRLTVNVLSSKTAFVFIFIFFLTKYMPIFLPFDEFYMRYFTV